MMPVCWQRVSVTFQRQLWRWRASTVWLAFSTSLAWVVEGFLGQRPGVVVTRSKRPCRLYSGPVLVVAGGAVS